MSLRSLAIAVGLLIGLAVPTAASAAYTTGSVNIRTGPGTEYGVITTAPPGAYIAVGSCVRSWCSVRFRGISGWMSSSYIASAPPRASWWAPSHGPPGPRAGW